MTNIIKSVPAFPEPIPLSMKQTIAFILSPRLGDSLISMVTVNNLLRNGYNVKVFGDYIYQLRNWFPTVNIQPRSTENDAVAIFKNFDVLLLAFKADLIGDMSWHPAVYILEQSVYNRLQIPYADIQVQFCKHLFLLQDIVRANDIKIPVGLSYRKNKQRVVIHPTSFEIAKNWLPQRFLQVAKLLKSKGFIPEFIVSPKEREEWLWIIEEGFSLSAFSSLDAVACWIYESDYFIGNDSGIGHLASNLGIPTITLCMRAKIKQRWRPSWAPGIALAPPRWLITRPLKERFWKYFISVKHVMQAMQHLTTK